MREGKGGGSPLARVEWNNEKAAAARKGRIDAQLGMTDTRTNGRADGHSRLTQFPTAAPLHFTVARIGSEEFATLALQLGA